MRYFAYLTKEQDLHYCHVFMVDSLVSAWIYIHDLILTLYALQKLANEIILTLGQAFEVAYQLALSGQNTPLLQNEQWILSAHQCATNNAMQLCSKILMPFIFHLYDSLVADAIK